MAKRVFLHVGTMKSGTSYLQSLLWKNRAALGERGLLLPGGRERGAHFQAAAVVTEDAEVLERLDPRDRRAWDALLAQSAETDGDVLISNEAFANATPGQADRALRRLEGAAGEVHVVLTARDLGRTLPSAWQQAVKRGHDETLETFWQRAAHDGPQGYFAVKYDVPAILERWGAGLPPERTHLVVLPRSGAPRDWLWTRVLELVGVDPAGLDTDPPRVNDSLGIAEVELLRRVQEAIPPERRDLDTIRYVKAFVREVLAPLGPRERFVVTPAMHAWALARSRTTVDRVRAGGWDVVGELDDLLCDPAPPAGRDPAQATGDEVAAVGAEALAHQLLRSLDQRDRIRELRSELRSLVSDEPDE